MKYILLITLVLALHWTIASATQSRWKRQGNFPPFLFHFCLYKDQALVFLPYSNKLLEVASATCGQQPNSVAICSPSTNETWYNGTYQEFTWNYKYVSKRFLFFLSHNAQTVYLIHYFFASNAAFTDSVSRSKRRKRKPTNIKPFLGYRGSVFTVRIERNV